MERQRNKIVIALALCVILGLVLSVLGVGRDTALVVAVVAVAIVVALLLSGVVKATHRK